MMLMHWLVITALGIIAGMALGTLGVMLAMK